jgi:integrase
MTFQELTDWYLDLEKVKALSSYWVIELSLKKFNSVFGGRIISQVKPAELENYQAIRRKEGKADGTIDHEIGKAKTMVFKAFDNDMISGDTLRTFKIIKKLVKRNSDARNRVLTKGEFDKLMHHLPRHTKAIVATGFYTGMREGEILNLTWDKVDLKNRFIRLEAGDTKDKEARNVPILDELYGILKTIPRGVHDSHVFLFKGKPINDIRTALRKACEKTGIIYGRFVKDGFIFHDLRHTFNTNMRKAGVPESVIMETTGHSTREMFDRYNTVDEEDIRKAIDQLGYYLQSVDQNVDQNQSTEE